MMCEIVRMQVKRTTNKRRRRSSVVPFPGPRQMRMIETIAHHLSTLTDIDAERFMVGHFAIEERRLVEQSVSEPDIDRYIFETARAIWMRLDQIVAGAA